MPKSLNKTSLSTLLSKSKDSIKKRRNKFVNLLRQIDKDITKKSIKNKDRNVNFTELLNIASNSLTANKTNKELLDAIGSMRKERQSRRLIDILESSLKDSLEDLAKGYNAKNLTKKDFLKKSKEALKTFSVASAIVGAGGIGNITPDIIKGVATNLEKQYQYFDRFSDKKLGLTTGINTTGAADHRISTKNITALRNYASSIKGTYEMAEAQVLSDGEYEVEERRVITAAESCVSCVTYASEGWVELGSLGEIGDSECGSRCKCYFEYRDRKKKK